MVIHSLRTIATHAVADVRGALCECEGVQVVAEVASIDRQIHWFSNSS